jgi:creatinine amidohydrolase
MRVNIAELRPEEFISRLHQRPVAYLPLGTLEWHGPHLPLGADALQSAALMVEAATRFGGIVLPPLFLGPDRRSESGPNEYLVGMDTARTTIPHQQLTGSCYWTSYPYFISLLEVILEQLKRAGFKAVWADGHGPSRRTWVQNISRFEEKFSIRILGVTEDIREQWSYMTDHAAFNESSILMYTHPELVNLSPIKSETSQLPQGVNGIHPQTANPDAGRKYFEEALELMKQKIISIPLIS